MIMKLSAMVRVNDSNDKELLLIMTRNPFCTSGRRKKEKDGDGEEKKEKKGREMLK